MQYRRRVIPGGTYFFTVVTHQRQPLFLMADRIALLRQAFRHVKSQQPFVIEGVVVLPDHLHCLWRLPEGDGDFSSRWREIKKFVSNRWSESSPGPRVWQGRFWEHLIRDEEDWHRHLDYLHYNPVKHGWVSAPRDWPWSSFHLAVRRGWYAPDWGADDPPAVATESWE